MQRDRSDKREMEEQSRQIKILAPNEHGRDLERGAPLLLNLSEESIHDILLGCI